MKKDKVYIQRMTKSQNHEKYAVSVRENTTYFISYEEAEAWAKHRSEYESCPIYIYKETRLSVSIITSKEYEVSTI